MFRVRTQLGLGDSPEPRESVVIGVLDSGVCLHPDLESAILAFRDFSGRAGSQGRKYKMHVPYDDYGHGTHVCGILCGNGKLSRGRYQGILPAGKLVVGKVLDEFGDGRAEDMLEGMAWMLRQREKYGIRILNVSVGISNLRDGNKLRQMQDMLRRMAREGILVVCAAGNQGPAAGSLSALGEMPEVISVGCHDGAYYRGDPNRCERFCGRGKDKAIPRKPDLVAPGTRIMSCSKNFERGLPYAYEERSGTSMAAPIVSGCIGRVWQAFPKLSSGQVKRILTATARDLGEPWNKQGWGMIQPRKMLMMAKDL